MINSFICSQRLAVLAGALLAGFYAQGAPILQGPSADYVAFEADLNATLIAGTPTTWVGTNDASASLGTALYADGLASPGNGPHSFAQYQLKFVAAGTYYLYYRWKADSARRAGDIFTANSTFLPNAFGNFATP